mgnify:CR=1 FL=1
MNKNCNSFIKNVENPITAKVKWIIKQLGLFVDTYKSFKTISLSEICNQKRSIAFANIRV